MTRTEGKDRKPTIWNKNYILCMVISSMSAVGHGMLNPSLPIYAKSLGIAVSTIGTVMAAAMFICMFGRAISGSLSDRINNKTLVLAAQLFLLLGYGLLMVSGGIPGLAVGKTLQAVGNGMNNTVLSTIAFASVPTEKLASGIGVFSLASSLAQCFSPNLGTELAGAGRFTLLFGIAIGMTVMSVISLTFVKNPVLRKKSGEKVAEEERGISKYICRPAIPAAIMLLFNGIVYSAIANYLSMYGLEKGLPRIGLFFTVNSITMLITRPLSGRICDRKPLIYIMLPGYLAQVAACVLISGMSSMTAVVIAAAFYGFGFGTTQAAIQVMAIRSVDASQRGRANGTFYVGGDIGLASGSYVAGALADLVGYSAMYVLMAVMAALCLGYFVLHTYRPHRILLQRNKSTDE